MGWPSSETTRQAITVVPSPSGSSGTTSSSAPLTVAVAGTRPSLRVEDLHRVRHPAHGLVEGEHDPLGRVPRGPPPERGRCRPGWRARPRARRGRAAGRRRRPARGAPPPARAAVAGGSWAAALPHERGATESGAQRAQTERSDRPAADVVRLVVARAVARAVPVVVLGRPSSVAVPSCPVSPAAVMTKLGAGSSSSSGSWPSAGTSIQADSPSSHVWMVGNTRAAPSSSGQLHRELERVAVAVRKGRPRGVGHGGDPLVDLVAVGVDRGRVEGLDVFSTSHSAFRVGVTELISGGIWMVISVVGEPSHPCPTLTSRTAKAPAAVVDGRDRDVRVGRRGPRDQRDQAPRRRRRGRGGARAGPLRSGPRSWTPLSTPRGVAGAD